MTHFHALAVADCQRDLWPALRLTGLLWDFPVSRLTGGGPEKADADCAATRAQISGLPWDLHDFLLLGARLKKPDAPSVQLANNPLMATAIISVAQE